MNAEWIDATLGQLCLSGEAELQTGPFGSQLHSRDYQPDGIPVIPTESIGRRRIRDNKMPRVSAETAARLSRHKVMPGDILFARRGIQATGLAALVEPKHNGWLCGTGVIRLRLSTSRIDTEFLSFALSSEETFAWIRAHAAGGVMPNVNEEILGRLPVRLPQLSEQKEIAALLGALDRKIDLNKQISRTLREMTSALFRSWFVDFDPVTARVSEHSPAEMDVATAELFPSSLVESSLGPIPKGWGVSSIGSIAEVVDCLHSKKPERRESGWPLLQLENIRDDGLIDPDLLYWIDEQSYRIWISRLEASPGDCVVTNVGRIGAVAQIPSGFKAALGRNMTGIRCKPSFQYPTFLLECLLSDSMRTEIDERTDAGTILSALNVRNIPRLRFCKPDVQVAIAFEERARPMRATMEHNLAESRTLAALRDALLPRVVSGRLRIAEAISLAEAVA